ncbi:constitutive coactivator of peroxisome proliferator-activated receptor gamma isoform X1 [Dromaius novaehollandiae]|uniref:constitutive coactivator of peroxisome proliferator-activated receptor gamma isoform X1 n=1 Tax=Dromaius novaehollandiae TaxID=8790 RepID=UPI000E1F7465|nr:constitutive coactivator of peroxisome proliferator-activated receptor gamma isoform X1 [Dromaius novaehollandiae]XP_025973003.1 constitutive coactivator of peroxisome proliferator-activated receptor gamma isoform X1 [Dromaius novaehollandiae]XP_025973005.1 constitutive coactivator of peroxisome proliferator-activated receptor gamma isoform X1 [Dromaius novaehollandiae]XP_025973006.1 constitutive coactivator of peroxisome proliferator-activated receptor gamma isoform X1 [Dromaius novaeholland
MGIKGLQGFMTKVCPDVCTMVNLKEMAERHRINHPDFPPVIVVDAMSCVRYWYTPESWVCGGQWQEYLANLENFIEAFMAAGIKLVFYFDGVVEEKKRDEWIKRRLQNNKEITRIFQFIKTHRKQPGREMFVIPSALPTFTRFALKSLGQKTICSLQEADFEVAAYGLQHNCMGILGQDSDYLIYNTSPYFSIEKLCLDRLVTVMYSREDLCRVLGLSMTHLPLFACLLGNDIVPESLLEGFWHKCLVIYPVKNKGYSRRTNILLAVANYISKVPCSYGSLKDLENMLPLGSDKTLLYRGMESYLLPGQQSPWIPPNVTNIQMFSIQQETAMCQDKEIFQLAKEQHIQSENYAIFNILSNGEIECSNSLEDECDTEIPGQALIYRPARQHIYSVLLESGKDGAYPFVKEWFVYFGNPLQQPELVQPIQPPVPGGTPNLKTLWFAKGPDVEKQRYSTFLACFHLQDMMEELQALEAPVAGFCCLLTYLILQVNSLSLEDLNAFVALILCLKGKTAAQLAGLQLAQVDSRAVHLGTVFIRGLTTLLMANSACGFPFRMDDLMPWKMFDGKLFQEKYQQSHRGCSLEELLEGSESLYTPFQNVKSFICKACMVKNRTIQSRQRGNGIITGTRQRELNPRFQQTRRTSFVPPYHYQMGVFPRRGPQPQGRAYRSGHPGQRRRFELPPRTMLVMRPKSLKLKGTR